MYSYTQIVTVWLIDTFLSLFLTFIFLCHTHVSGACLLTCLHVFSGFAGGTESKHSKTPTRNNEKEGESANINVEGIYNG